MGSGKRKLTLYTNGKKVKEVSIQHEKKEERISFGKIFSEMRMRQYERLLAKRKDRDSLS